MCICNVDRYCQIFHIILYAHQPRMTLSFSLQSFRGHYQTFEWFLFAFLLLLVRLRVFLDALEQFMFPFL